MKLFKIPILALLFFVSCKEEYFPKVKSSDQSVLVVEGVLNSGPGPTTIKLTRTFKLDDSAQQRQETGAQLIVEGKSSATFPLYDSQGNGTYLSEQLQLDPTEQYRLHIITSDAKEYASDYLTAKQTPRIDSVSWQQNKDGVFIYMNTHDDANATRYYKWDYEETWKFHAGFNSILKYDNGRLLNRDPSESVYTSWRNFTSSTINVASSANLQSDVIHLHPLLFISHGTEKLSVRYSILVKQYAITKDAYDFYQLMKKNTETLGSIFDAQPTEITGNIHAITNPGELVIGYITVSSVEEKRLFIDTDDLGQWGYATPCQSQLIDNTPENIKLYFPYLLLPYDVKKEGLELVGYYASTPSCTDCTMVGGTLQKPSFW